MREAYNRGHGIEPKTIIKDAASLLLQLSNLDYHDAGLRPLSVGEVTVTDPASIAKVIAGFERQMRAAAKRLRFDRLIDGRAGQESA